MKKFTDKIERLLEACGVKKDIAFLSVSAAALVISIFDMIPAPFDFAWIAIILCGVPIILEALVGLITAFDIRADVLVSMALIASVIIGEDFAAGEVAFIMQLGALLEDLTVARARAGIEKLVRLTPQTARVTGRSLDGSGSKGTEEISERIIPAEQVQVGDILRVLPGENGAGGRCNHQRADLDQSGGHDGGITAGGQDGGRRSIKRYCQSVWGF